MKRRGRTIEPGEIKRPGGINQKGRLECLEVGPKVQGVLIEGERGKTSGVKGRGGRSLMVGEG